MEDVYHLYKEGDKHLFRQEYNDSAVHDVIVTRELSKLMLLPQDVKEQKGHSLNDVIASIYPGIVRVSISQLCSSQCTSVE